jgi:hypothetical protein
LTYLHRSNPGRTDRQCWQARVNEPNYFWTRFIPPKVPTKSTC